ncbi:MAG: acyl-CoA dehydrogenase family protein [Mycobacterium sp.]
MKQGTDAHHMFATDVHAFYTDYVAPRYRQWRQSGAPPREFWYTAADAGILGIHAAAEYGGTDGRFAAMVREEAARTGVQLDMLGSHTDVAVSMVNKLGNAEQRSRWLPEMVSGRTVATTLAIDCARGATAVRAVRHRNSYIVYGSGGLTCPGADPDLIIVPVSPDRFGVSLLAVDTRSPRLSRRRTPSSDGLDWRPLEIGFDDVVVPADNLLGDPDQGLRYLTECAVQQKLSHLDFAAVTARRARSA